MLLEPLGIDPRWVERSALQQGGVYYGSASEPVGEAVLRLPLRQATLDYFAARIPYRPSDVAWETWAGERWPVLFAGASGTGGDLVASTFFWLSGWQEHVVRARDRHGRFPHDASLQAALGVTTRPVVDAYRERLEALLRAQGVRVDWRTWGRHRWAFCPTHDIDYLRKWRPGMIYREVVLNLVRNQRRTSLPGRLRRAGQFVADWASTGDASRTSFERLHDETRQRGGAATFFVKTGAHDPHDVAYSPKSRYLRGRLLALEDDGFEVGLHPSYHAHAHPGYLVEEVERLQRLLGRRPVSVRQHYLRFDTRVTPRLQLEAGFTIDSSLGFAEHEGFRHATCLPFQLYDLAADAPLPLWEMPLAVMEATLFNRRGQTLAQAQRSVEALMRTCKRFGGCCVGLWHNTAWDEMDHPGWGAHFLHALDYAVAQGAHITSLREALASWRAASGTYHPASASWRAIER